MSRALLILLSAGLIFGQSTGSIQGVVRNEVTGEGIPGVHVVVVAADARHDADTDAAGSFLKTGVARGMYQAHFEKKGYTLAAYQSTPFVEVTSGVSQMEITLSGSAVLRGRVVDAEGKPVKGSSVRLLDFSEVGILSKGPKFEFTGIRPGYYTLVAIPPEGDSNLAPTYYPSALDPYGAIRIAVLGDRDLDGLEIRTLVAHTVRISGRVVTESGKPAVNARVTLHPMTRNNGRMTGGNQLLVYPADENTGPAEQQLQSKDGSFTFNAPKGDWTIAAITGVRADSTVDPQGINLLRQGAVRLGVDRGDIENVEIRLATPIEITGSIEWEDATPAPGIVYANPVTGPNVPLNMQGQLNRDGTFKLMALPGRVYFTMPSRPGFYPASMTMGGQEVLGVPLDLSSEIPPLHVVMKRTKGTIRGKADPGTSFVVLIPAQVDHASFGRQIFPAKDGTFEVNLAPGSYVIGAFAGPRSLDPAILDKVRTAGVHIRVEDSDPATVELKPMRWLE
jgi:hypothetical protein